MSGSSIPSRPRLHLLLLLMVAACGGRRDAERVTLPPGSTFNAVTDSLVAHGVVSSRLAFKLLARVRGVDRSVHAGVYEFAPHLSAWRVLGVLAAGKTAAVRFTVPEGLTILDVAALAAERLKVPEDSVLAAARDGRAASALLGFRVSSFEGFLRPETYALPPGMPAGELVRLMAEGFTAAWEPAWTARLDSLHMSEVQLVTLASIVEGEARVDGERETIAGVYLNRLRIGRALQADPTDRFPLPVHPCFTLDDGG